MEKIFIKNKSNADAYEKCTEALKSPRFPIIISGPNGCGKTHLLNSLCSKVLSAEKLVSCLIDDKKQSRNVFYNEILSYDQLIIDNCHYLENKPATQEELFILIDKFISLGKPVILATENLKNIKVLKENLVEKYGEICISKIPPADKAMRREFLLALCENQKISLENEIITLLSEKEVSLRVLEGYIAKIKLALSLKEEITKEWVEEKV